MHFCLANIHAFPLITFQKSDRTCTPPPPHFNASPLVSRGGMTVKRVVGMLSVLQAPAMERKLKTLQPLLASCAAAAGVRPFAMPFNYSVLVVSPAATHFLVRYGASVGVYRNGGRQTVMFGILNREYARKYCEHASATVAPAQPVHSAKH